MLVKSGLKAATRISLGHETRLQTIIALTWAATDCRDPSRLGHLQHRRASEHTNASAAHGIDLAKLAPGKNLQHTHVWALRATEGIYQVLRLPNTHSIPRTDTAGRRSFYAGVLASVIRNESAQLLSVTPFPSAGGAGIEYKYKGLHKGSRKRVIKYGRVLLLDSIGYTLNFVPTDQQDSLGIAGAEPRRRFYNSITVKP